jgi:hypothetical protein
MVRIAFAIVASLAVANGFTTLPVVHDASRLLQATRPLSMVATSSENFGDDLPDGLPRKRSRSGKAKGVGRSVQEEDNKSKFVDGDELHRLRHEVLAMRLELQEARRSASKEGVRELERAIMSAQQVDAEFVYTVSLERMDIAQEKGMFQEAETYKQQAIEARNALPQFNLEGLWVGKYGDYGYEMINVTYQGDTLIAQKITGTKNVPKGESTFEVDLDPKVVASQEEVLEPIELGESATRQWGCKYLQRFPGKGQVAADGYLDSRWIDGQLIMVNEYFSFAWLPIGHQVFFGRPTPELILKLMKDDKTKETGDCSARLFLEKCWEETEHMEDDHEVSEGPFVSSEQQNYYHQEGCFE